MSQIYIIHFNLKDLISGKTLHKSKIAKSDKEREEILKNYIREENGKIKYVSKYDQVSGMYVTPVREDIYMMENGRLIFLTTRKLLL